MNDSVGLTKVLSIFQERVREQTESWHTMRVGSFATGRPRRRSLLRLGFGSAGLSNDHLATEQNISRGEIGISDSIEHHRKSDSADIPAGLVQCGERHGKEAGILHIVDPNDPDIFRNSFAYRHKRVHQLACGKVIGAEKRIGSILLQNCFYECLIRRVPKVHRLAIRSLCKSLNRFLESDNTSVYGSVPNLASQ